MMGLASNRQDQDDARYELRTSKWLNPTDHVQRVVVYDGTNRRQVIVWRPGETKEIDSVYDGAIQKVDCGQDHCHKGAGKKGGGWFCALGHPGQIVGGLAPLLKRIGAEDTLDPALDPALAEKKEAQAQIAAAAMATKAAQSALIVAAANVIEKENTSAIATSTANDGKSVNRQK
jgi:hypothetical protein